MVVQQQLTLVVGVVELGPVVVLVVQDQVELLY